MNVVEEKQQKDDERVTWIRQSSDREIVQRIKRMPKGFSVTTEWWEKGKIVRQDVHVAICEGEGITGVAQELK